ncbi:hypothetical protein SAMN05216228_1009170 [Rhizobium tibeticum]|uniref:Uncharacterized protein n=1 Tax=Rhizobium tibeticum TaxID=501024 RepID=A0A1H8KS19_9HYPH|nr:hypothetical protein RTCCBAU85039_2623 [Rhizobium tibeticum]SEN95702.1 hypothetical protein SAMN05216228_1009170 [Rhizobium tibeticum]
MHFASAITKRSHNVAASGNEGYRSMSGTRLPPKSLITIHPHFLLHVTAEPLALDNPRLINGAARKFKRRDRQIIRFEKIAQCLACRR